MKVNFNTFLGVNTIQNQGVNNYSGQNFSRLDSMQADVFVKSANNVSFGREINKEKIKDVASDLAAIGMIGGTFVLSIAACSHAMNNMDVKHIFLPDGTYLTSVDKLKTGNITADTTEGILKIKGTPIDIDASRYDFADIEKGVFKNYDGSVDIDLANNKYIDIEHGVIVDPESQVSFIKNAEGVFENAALPAVDSPNFLGSSMSANQSPPRLPISREEYIEKHGIAPENEPHLKDMPKERLIPKDYWDKITVPNDNRSTSQKIVDFFNPFSGQGRYPYDHSKSYDIFGREIVTITKPNGSVSKVAIDENLQAVLDKYHLKTDSLGEIADFCEKLKMKEYLLEYHPAYVHEFVPHTENLTEFLHRVTENHSDIVDVITNDAITETVTNSDLHTSFLDILRGIAESF